MIDQRASNSNITCGTGSVDDPACHFPENEACCDCKSEVRCLLPTSSSCFDKGISVLLTLLYPPKHQISPKTETRGKPERENENLTSKTKMDITIATNSLLLLLPSLERR